MDSRGKGGEVTKADMVDVLHVEDTEQYLSSHLADEEKPVKQDVDIAEDWEHSLTNRQALSLYRKAVFWAFLASLSIIMEGYDLSVTGNNIAMPVFQQYFGTYYPRIDEYQIPAPWQSALITASTIGNIIGIPLGGVLIERFGYRYALIGNYFLIMPFIAISAFARNLPMLFCGGLLQGIPFGVYSTLAVGYASEVCPAKLRGYLTGWVNICWVLGILFGTGIANVVVKITSTWGFRAGYMTQWAWPILLSISMWLAPDAPWWMVRKGRIEEAERALKRLTRPEMHDRIPDMVSNMARTYQFEVDVSSGSRWIDCFKGPDWRRTEISCMAFANQSLCGDPFLGGPIYFFQQAGVGTDLSFKLGLVNPAFMFLANIFGFYLMSRFGRRKLYLSGMSGCLVGLLLVGILQVPSNRGNKNAKWGQATLVFIWNIWRGMHLGPQCYSIVAEAPSSRLRNKTIALARLTYQLIGLCTNFLQPWLINPSALDLKGYAAFVWAPICVVGLTWTYFRLPEFKDRTFFELDVLFERKVNTRKFAKTMVEVGADDEIRESKKIRERV